MELRGVFGFGGCDVKLAEARLVAVRAERHMRRRGGPNREAHPVASCFVGVGRRELLALVDANERVRDGEPTLVDDHPRHRDREWQESREPECRARRSLDGLEGRGEYQKDEHHRGEREPSPSAGGGWWLLRVDDPRHGDHPERSR